VRVVALAILMLLVAALAHADTLITSVSTPRVAIQSNFTGADIVVFGGIERSPGPREHGRYDIVIVIKGPAEPLDVRRKDRVLGIWINAERRPFRLAPSYIAIASTRPLSEIAAAPDIARFGLSFETAIGAAGTDLAADDSQFRAALVRLKREAGLYLEKPAAVTFLSDNLFRATVPLPANVPLGLYQVETRLFADGTVLAGQRASLEVIKTGFDDTVAHWANDRSAIYGTVTCILALSLGWLATIVFRRD
jgi:uncharacterized protein (TIGR02186 family)